MTLTPDIPPETEAAKLVKTAVALYDARLLSQGRAAEMSGLSRAEFIDALGWAGVAVFQYDSVEELLAEAGFGVVPSSRDGHKVLTVMHARTGWFGRGQTE